MTGCSMNNQRQDIIDKVVYYENGVAKNITIDNKKALITLIRELIKGTDDCLRLIVTRNIIDDEKQKRCLEILFKDEISVIKNNGEKLSFSKILISLNNDDETNDYSPVVFYCGKKVYFTPPYINSKGVEITNKIKILGNVH